MAMTIRRSRRAATGLAAFVASVLACIAAGRSPNDSSTTDRPAAHAEPAQSFRASSADAIASSTAATAPAGSSETTARLWVRSAYAISVLFLGGPPPGETATATGTIDDLGSSSVTVAGLTCSFHPFPNSTIFAGPQVGDNVTLTCTGIAMKSFYEARRAHPGFDASGVLLAAVKLDTSGYSRDQAAEFLDRLQQRLATMPGVVDDSSERNPKCARIRFSSTSGTTSHTVAIATYPIASTRNRRNSSRTLDAPDSS